MTQQQSIKPEQIAGIIGSSLAGLLTGVPVRTINARLQRAGQPQNIKPLTVFEKLANDPATASAIMELVHREVTYRPL